MSKEKCKKCNNKEKNRKRNLCGSCIAKDWRKKNPEKIKEYLKRTKERRKKYYEENRDKIMEKWDKYYTKNRKEIQQRKKKQRQANGYKEDKTEARKKMAYIRQRTAKKYPLKGQKCEKCPNKAEHRHHTTSPPEVDKFIFVCKDCHDKIHGRKNYQKKNANV